MPQPMEGGQEKQQQGAQKGKPITAMGQPANTSTVVATPVVDEELVPRRIRSRASLGTLTATMVPPTVPLESEVVDVVICKLLMSGAPNQLLSQTLSAQEIFEIITLARLVFTKQPCLVEFEPPVKVCGDIHGQYADLLRLLDRGGFPPSANYLFLGDYIDRGRNSLEVMLLLFCYKIKYPNAFFLLRGNHECRLTNQTYGFYDECLRRYNNVDMWQEFQKVFGMMPLTAVIGQRILCMHGGISPRLTSLQVLRDIERPFDNPANPSLAIDILWSDPGTYAKGWQTNSRGVSYIFGADKLKEVIDNLGIDLVVRAHQVVQDGYEFFANKRLVTIFSAPHYCGQFDNAAAIMNVDDNLNCSFLVLRPVQRSLWWKKSKH